MTAAGVSKEGSAAAAVGGALPPVAQGGVASNEFGQLGVNGAAATMNGGGALNLGTVVPTGGTEMQAGPSVAAVTSEAATAPAVQLTAASLTALAAAILPDTASVEDPLSNGGGKCPGSEEEEEEDGFLPL